jgi:NADPH2:quinone reductase
MNLPTVSIPDVTPGPQDVVVHIAASGVTLDDVLDHTGETERELPYTPGFEAVGTIVGVGPQVSSLRIGERVACLAPAAYADQLVAPQEHVVPIPQGLDDLQAVLTMSLTRTLLSCSARWSAVATRHLQNLCALPSTV